jgi:hypothetical protein
MHAGEDGYLRGYLRDRGCGIQIFNFDKRYYIQGHACF